MKPFSCDAYRLTTVPALACVALLVWVPTNAFACAHDDDSGSTRKPAAADTIASDEGEEAVGSAVLIEIKGERKTSPDGPTSQKSKVENQPVDRSKAAPKPATPPNPSGPSANKPAANQRADEAKGSKRSTQSALQITSGFSPKQPAKAGRKQEAKTPDEDAKAKLEDVLRQKSDVTTHQLDENGIDLSLEAQQQKDEGECPGSEASKKSASRPLSKQEEVNDVPLEQEEHPFDAPAAPSEISEDETSAMSEMESADPSEPAAPVEGSASDDMQTRINMCLAHYFINKENLTKRSPWAVMHTILPYGVETDIIAGSRQVNAIGWMCYNGVCKSQRVFQSTRSGFRTNVGPGVQGHEGQFLAILAQSGVPRDFPILVGKTRYTVSDLIRYEMVTCQEKSELTFKLIGLSHYLAPRQTWRDEKGRVWNLEKLVREELEQPVVGAACGGTHRLMGLSYALMMRRRYKEPIVNHWAHADAYLKDFIQYAWSLQNPDGSFSTDWLAGRADEPDMERKVQTTGHILEWLIFALPAEDLKDPRVTRSMEFILSQVYKHRDKDWPIGPRGHALRALALYNQRVHGAPVGQMKNYLAETGYLQELR